jgi:hypothetical protein
MLIERLDRTAWKLEQARERIARQLLVSSLAAPSPANERSVQTPPWIVRALRSRLANTPARSS